MIDVAAAIIEKQGPDGTLVLAARRKAGAHMAGFWEFPGGKIEANETAQQCLVRELAEELTITASVGEMIGQSIHHYDTVSVRLLAYRAVQVAGEIELIDHDKLIWLAPEALDQLNWAAADIPLVKSYQLRHHTANYYQANAQTYFDERIADETTVTPSPLEANRDAFLQQLNAGDHILDLGCGSGRDSLAFLQAGYTVTAIDGCAELAELAAKRIGQPVTVISFEGLNDKQLYDGIWACASLLHCDKGQITLVLGNVINALKPGGSAYLSFKWGDDETVDDKGRFFNNYTDMSLRELLGQFDDISINRLWDESQLLRGAPQRWVNVLIGKSGGGTSL
ncbi:MAG: mutator protein MutT [Phenylobacterium sp.]|jgi:mutator protein MutT